MNIKKYFWVIRGLLYKPFFNKFGNLSYIGKPLYISGTKNISIGSKTRIFPGIRLEVGGAGSIKIGDNVVIEQNAHIVSYGNELNIGDDTTISANVFISNVDHDYKSVDLSVMDQELIYKKTKIGNSCFLGYGSSILPGTVLGNHCIVGANSVVKGEFPSNCVIAGAPAIIIKKYNDKTKEWERNKN